jgi:outer membrane protein assembly factor BamB
MTEELPPRAVSKAMGLVGVLRLIIGLAATMGGQIYPLMTVLVWWLAVAGRPSIKFTAAFLASGLLSMAATWGLGKRFPIAGVAQAVLASVLALWFVATLAIGGAVVEPSADRTWLLSAYAGATLWVPWLSWFFFLPGRLWLRTLVLVVLLSPMAALHRFVRVQGLSGEQRYSIAWRSASALEAKPAAAGGETVEVKSSTTDYPQFLGPHRDGAALNAAIDPDWMDHPPRKAWSRDVGAGHGSFAIVGDLAFTQEQRDGDECVVCYHLADGREAWVHRDSGRFLSGLGGVGPRATPTVENGKLYCVGALGLLQCLDASNGKMLWSVNLLSDHGVDNLLHGVAASPLLVDDLVVVCPPGPEGKSLAAYSKETGKRVWTAGSGASGYGSPMLAEIGGVRQILVYNAKDLAAHTPADGKLLWKFEWSAEVNCSQPVVHAGGADQVFVSTGYGKGCALLKVEAPKQGDWKVQTLWTSRNMKNKMTSSVAIGDCVFGLDDGILSAVDLKNGDRLWKSGRYGHGQILRVGKYLIVQAENGDAALVEPTRKGGKELGRIKGALDGKTWNNPAFAPPRLLLRNDHQAACFELPMK